MAHWIWKALMVAGATLVIASILRLWHYYLTVEFTFLTSAFNIFVWALFGALLWAIGFTVRWWKRT